MGAVAWIVVVLVLIWAVMAWQKRSERSKRLDARSEAIRKRQPRSAAPPPGQIEARLNAGDASFARAERELTIDEMRAGLQQIAGTMVGRGVDPDTKARFKQEMTEFASVDPLVKEIAERARQLVAESPGMLQSKIYVRFHEHNKDQVRYALYFAHELGWIHRKKKGSSYQLFPPGRVVDGEVV